MPRQAALDQLQQALIDGRNADGGWGYYTGKASRLEPTCWALLALGADGGSRASRDPASAWLAQCQRSTGWLVEDVEWPVNIAFNSLAAFTLYHRPELLGDDGRQRLISSVIASKGAPAPPADGMRQDNSLQGWSWTDATFSWVEPTCWGLLSLKKWGLTPSAAARIAEGERLLLDRSCQPGGWNFGNATVMGQDLRPYMPTTALALLALQDRPADEAVIRALAYLEANWEAEISAIALGLSLACLGVYRRPADRVVTRLSQHAATALTFGNHHGIAVALFALSSFGQPHAFRL